MKDSYDFSKSVKNPYLRKPAEAIELGFKVPALILVIGDQSGRAWSRFPNLPYAKPLNLLHACK